MKNKTSQFTMKGEPKLTTTKQLAKQRGLDLKILEREAGEFGFGTIKSGVMYVDESEYDSWISTQIRQNGMEKAKRVSHKSIAESDNIGILHAIIAKLTEQLKKDEPQLQFQQQEIPKMVDGIKKKQALKSMIELSDKVTGKKEKIQTANRRLEHLLDAALGLLDSPREAGEIVDEETVTEGPIVHIGEE